MLHRTCPKFQMWFFSGLSVQLVLKIYFSIFFYHLSVGPSIHPCHHQLTDPLTLCISLSFLLSSDKKCVEFTLLFLSFCATFFLVIIALAFTPHCSLQSFFTSWWKCRNSCHLLFLFQWLFSTCRKMERPTVFSANLPEFYCKQMKMQTWIELISLSIPLFKVEWKDKILVSMVTSTIVIPLQLMQRFHG